MEKLIETFRIEDGKPLCLTEHQRRVEESTRRLTGRRTVINLKDIHIPPQYEKGIVKCSVTYDERLCGVVFRHYRPAIIRKLKAVFADRADYSLKYADRTLFSKLLEQKGDCDDILIIRQGLVTDTSYSNIVFSDGSDYFTPDSFLLNGCRRRRLLAQKRIRQRRITVDDIGKYEYALIINAMLDMEDNPCKIEVVI